MKLKLTENGHEFAVAPTPGPPKEKVIQNISNIIQKAITMRQDKIYLGVDVFYILDGSIRAVFNINELDSAVLRLKIFETNEQKSTKVAKSYFSDFGISENNKQTKATKKQEESADITSFPDLPLDAITLTQSLVVTFVRPQYAWNVNLRSPAPERKVFEFCSVNEIKKFL